MRDPLDFEKPLLELEARIDELLAADERRLGKGERVALPIDVVRQDGHRDALIDRKKILGGGSLPGKLMDCTTRDRDESEPGQVVSTFSSGRAENGDFS